MKRFGSKIIAVVLCLCMTLSVITLTVTAQPEFVSNLDGLDINSDEKVKAIVVFEGKALSDLGYSSADIAIGNAHYAKEQLTKNQLELVKAYADKLTVGYQYTNLINGMSVETDLATLKSIERTKGVKSVSIVREYDVPETEYEANVEFANDEITMATELHKNGYDGDGIVIAVLDTGLNFNHEAFQDYGIIDNTTIDQDYYAGLELNAADPQYYSAKVPFAYDYGDDDNDATDANGHGTHCAGIAAGYAEDGEGKAEFTGTAPAAQLCIMKISIGDTGNASDETIAAALEDCYALGVDVISLSFGMDSGFTGDDAYDCFAEIFDKMDKAGISFISSAGNSNNYSAYTSNRFAAVYGVASVMSSSIEYGYTGSPACYPTAISVASADNAKELKYAIILADDSVIAYNENMSGENAVAFKTLAGEDLHVVVIPGLGADTDYNGLDVDGKVALIKRGTIDFQTKYNNAVAAGAKAVIIYNNVVDETLLNMIISDMTIPAVFVTNASGLAIIAQVNGGNDVIRTLDKKVVLDNGNEGQLSSFSSWGVTGDMRLMPTVTAVGGVVSSASFNDNEGYITMSGTSMSCPNFAGIYAIIEQYAIEKLGYSKDSKKTLDSFVEDLLLSTAEPIAETSVLGQGVGIVNCTNAINAQYYISKPVSDGMSNVSADGTYTFDITVKRFDDSAAASLDIVPYLYIDDYAVADWFRTGEYSFYNVLTPLELSCGETADDDYQMTVNTESGKVEFAAGADTATVSVTVTLSDALMDDLDVIYEYGNYIYGYFYLADGETEIVAHSTFVGFYGDFDSAPGLEPITSFDIVDAQAYLNNTIGDAKGNTLAQLGYTVKDLLEFEIAYSQFLLMNSRTESAVNYLGLGVGTFVSADRMHNAISTPLGTNYLADTVFISPSVLRSLASLKMVVTDAKTGEVVYVDDTLGVRKTSYDSSKDSFINFSVFMWDGMIYDEDGFAIDYCESGSKFNVEFFATNAHEGAVEHRIDNYCFNLVVDYTAPEFIYHYDAETRTLSYSIGDNYLLQIVKLLDQNGKTLLNIDVSDVEEGCITTGEYIVPDDVTEVAFVAFDWATNFVEGTVNSLEEDCTNRIWTVSADATACYISPALDYIECYMSDDDNTMNITVYDGDTCYFTLEPVPGYTAVDPKVYIDGAELTPNDEGIYSFVPTKDTVITIEGVEDITAPAPMLIDINTFTLLTNGDEEFTIVTEPFVYTTMYLDLGSPITEVFAAVSSEDYDIEAEDAAKIIDLLDWKNSVAMIYNATGYNYIYVYAKDSAGNIGYYKYAVFYDNTAPKIAVTASNYGKDINIAVYDELSDLGTVAITDVTGKAISDEYITESGEGGYLTYSISGLPDGIYVINVSAADIYGNKTEFTYTTSISTIPELTVDGVYLAGLPEKTTSSELKNMYSGNVKVRDTNGKELKQNDYVGTGCTVNYLDAGVPVVVAGDVNGDGRVTIIDLVHIKRTMQGIETLEGEYLTAAKVSGGSRISIKDYVSVKRHLQGLSSLYND